MLGRSAQQSGPFGLASRSCVCIESGIMPSLPDVYRVPKQLSVTERLRWVEDRGDTLRLLVALEDTWGVTIEGLVLRGRALKRLPDREVTLQLEFPHDRQRTDNAIERIDWKPLQPHNNKGRGPPELQYQIQHGTHLHGFELNWLESEQRMRKSNLPIARQINEQIQVFRDLLEFSEKQFNIAGLVALPHPPWEGTLL